MRAVFMILFCINTFWLCYNIKIRIYVVRNGGVICVAKLKQRVVNIVLHFLLNAEYNVRLLLYV